MNNASVLPALLSVGLLLPGLAVGQPRQLIVAPDHLVNLLEPLKRFRDYSGRPTFLVCLGQIDAEPQFAGVDAPERVKRCITYYEEHHQVQQVLLVGDVDQFPMRYVWWGKPGQEGWQMTDLYFADLYKTGTRVFDTWDANQNGLYQEIEFDPDGSLNNDGVDLLPDVAVGRIPASNAQQLTNYVAKLIRYELQTRATDSWFQNAGLHTGCWQPDENTTSDRVGTLLALSGFNVIKRYSDWPDGDPNHCRPPSMFWPMPDTALADLNGPGLGLWGYLGHGAQFGLSGPNLWSDLLGARSLTNASQLPVVFAAGCDTAMLVLPPGGHQYVDVEGTEHCGYYHGEDLLIGPYPHEAFPKPNPVQFDSRPSGNADGVTTCEGQAYSYDAGCMGEDLLFKFGNPVGSGGAVAYIGATSGAQPTVVDLYEGFFQAYRDGERILGNLWRTMVERYHAKHDLAESGTWYDAPEDWQRGHVVSEPRKFVVLGDPFLVVGGAFNALLSGPVSDDADGPLATSTRHRVVGQAEVSPGLTLTAQPASSLLFEAGSSITTHPGTTAGFRANGLPDQPVGLLAASSASPGQPLASSPVIRGMVVRGQVRMSNGGEIRMH